VNESVDRITAPGDSVARIVVSREAARPILVTFCVLRGSFFFLRALRVLRGCLSLPQHPMFSTQQIPKRAQLLAESLWSIIAMVQMYLDLAIASTHEISEMIETDRIVLLLGIEE
jgi:hypothetical protein